MKSNNNSNIIMWALVVGVPIMFSDIAVGTSETVTQQVMVTENGGRYVGSDAYIQFTVTITRVS